jgi:hypothetical protein
VLNDDEAYDLINENYTLQNLYLLKLDLNFAQPNVLLKQKFESRLSALAQDMKENNEDSNSFSLNLIRVLKIKTVADELNTGWADGVLKTIFPKFYDFNGLVAKFHFAISLVCKEMNGNLAVLTEDPLTHIAYDLPIAKEHLEVELGGTIH